MEINSAEKLYKFLISCAFQRCRMLEDLCRLSVSLKPSLPIVRISVSDTGVGSTLEEFQDLKYQNDPMLEKVLLTGDGVVHLSNQKFLVQSWQLYNSQIHGVLCLATTSISDEEIHHLKLDMKEVPSKRLVMLPSATKNGAKFSGTEVSLSMYEEFDGLLATISVFIRKMLVLKVPKIAIELSVDSGGSLGPQSERIILQNACSALPMHSANVDYLKLGFEEYVCKHGNRLVEACHSCFSTGMNLKVGTGIACSTRKQQSGNQVLEVVIIISEVFQPAQSSCFRLYGRKTEVLYFRDFSPCSISQSSLEALTSIEWKKYGLALKSVGDQDGVTLLEWENLPPCAHIDIVLHRYHKHVTILPSTQSNQIDRSLTRKAVKLALNDLKELNAGVLLSERAHKICKYAPDLAKTISGLILSSNDLNFQEECISLLGLQSSEGNERNVVEECIKDKLLSVIATNDRNYWGTREAPCLFIDDAHQQPDGEEYEEGVEEIGYLDL